MRAHLPRLVGAAAATLFFVTAGTAQAQGKGHGHGNDHAQAEQHHEADHDTHDEHHVARDDHSTEHHDVLREAQRNQRDRDRRDARDDHGQYDHGQYDHGQYDPRYDDRNGRRIPPGLAKKPGGMPPGQYKKLYNADQGAGVLRDVMSRRGYTVVRSADAGQSEYVYYRLRDGSTRRAIVSPGTDRLQFSNVPSSLLSEVLSRLY